MKMSFAGGMLEKILQTTITTLNANSDLNFGPLKSQMSGMETIYL